MPFTSQQIEAITQDVLRELRSLGVSIAAVQNEVPSRPSNAITTGEHSTLNARVITEDALAAAGVSGRTVSIPAGAVITPSGHDYIRRHRVSVTNGAAEKSEDASGVLIVVGSCSAASSAATSARWSVIEAGCEFDAAYKAQKTRKQLPRPVICCGGQPAVVACLLNRNRELRAAVVAPDTDFVLLSESMNPHVVCMDSSGWSFAAFRRLFRQVDGSDLVAPSNWKELR